MSSSFPFLVLAALSLGGEEPEPLQELCPLYTVFFDEGDPRNRNATLRFLYFFE